MSFVTERINNLAKKFSFITYLEIGVFRGETFFGVNLEQKTGVDPNFQFDIDKYKILQELTLYR